MACLSHFKGSESQVCIYTLLTIMIFLFNNYFYDNFKFFAGKVKCSGAGVLFFFFVLYIKDIIDIILYYLIIIIS